MRPGLNVWLGLLTPSYRTDLSPEGEEMRGCAVRNLSLGAGAVLHRFLSLGGEGRVRGPRHTPGALMVSLSNQ